MIHLKSTSAWTRAIVGLLTFCYTLAAWAEEPIRAISLDDLIDDANGRVSIGIKVTDLKSNETLFEKNATRTYTPASNQKVITAAAGLLYLGSDYRFKTRLYASEGSTDNGQFNGNVTIKFSGDPDLRIHHLNELIKELTNRGSNRINGDVYLDESAYGGQDLGPGWMWDDTRYCFSAPIGANIVNQNCIGIRVIPGKAVGSPIVVKFSEANQYITVINKAVTKGPDTKGCYVRLKTAPRNTYQLTGCLSLNAKSRGLSVALDDPDKFNKEVVKGLFKKNNIQIMGSIKRGRAKDAVLLIAEHKSRPLRENVNEMLKESDNLISDTLFKKLGSAYFRGQGTWKTGSKAVRRILANKVDLRSYDGVIADGSGLSRYNLVSPAQMVYLLTKLYKKPSVSNEFISALPVSGVDGTLKHRMAAPGFRGKVKAKTGTMANVTSLSGYVYTKKNNVLAFSIIINGVPGKTRKYQDLEDRICQFLVENY